MKPPPSAARRMILGSVAAFPLVMLTAMVWAVNRTHPYIGPFPFLLFWIVAWVFVTPFFMAVVYVLDHRWSPEEDPQDVEEVAGGDNDVT